MPAMSPDDIMRSYPGAFSPEEAKAMSDKTGYLAPPEPAAVGPQRSVVGQVMDIPMAGFKGGVDLIKKGVSAYHENVAKPYVKAIEDFDAHPIDTTKRWAEKAKEGVKNFGYDAPPAAAPAQALPEAKPGQIGPPAPPEMLQAEQAQQQREAEAQQAASMGPQVIPGLSRSAAERMYLGASGLSNIDPAVTAKKNASQAALDDSQINSAKIYEHGVSRIALETEKNQQELERIERERAIHEEERQTAHREYLSSINKKIEQYNDTTEIDPNRIWNNASTGTKVALAVRGWAAGTLAGYGNNAGLQMIEKETQNDIDAQKELIARKGDKINLMRGMYSDLIRQGVDERTAELATQQASLMRAKAAIETEVAKNQALQANNGVKQTIAAIDNKNAMIQEQMQQSAGKFIWQAMQPRQVAGTGDTAGKDMEYIADWQAAIPKDSAKDVRKFMASKKEYMKVAQELVDMREKGILNRMSPEQRGIMEGKSRRLVSLAKNVYDLGVLAGADLELVAVPPAGGASFSPEVTPSIKESMKQMDAQEKIMKETMGAVGVRRGFALGPAGMKIQDRLTGQMAQRSAPVKKSAVK